ncbi:MAG: hypothetical protein K0R02_857 [Rickettsiaceae bacterium]|jgi:adenylate kinase family enzyme|nr:hypothetical protein [Rickettsiaceae bacterium]
MDRSFKRIMIFGRPGSGKSTLASKIHKSTQIALYHLDKFFYHKDWVEINYDDFLAKQKSIVKKPTWIIDGNNLKSLEMRYSQSDLVCYFNLPRAVCFFRIIKRFFYKDNTIDDRPYGCKEKIDLKLLRYMWNFENRVTEKINYLKNKYPHVKFFEINSDKDLIELEKLLCK